MEDGRTLLRTLETSTRHDLGVHLLSAFLVKTLRKPRRGQDEHEATDLNEGTTRSKSRFFPPRSWTAWPLDPSVAPIDRLINENDCMVQIPDTGGRKLIMSRSVHRRLLGQGFNPDIVRILNLTPHEANQLDNTSPSSNGGTLEAHVNLATQIEATVERHINQKLHKMGLERNLDLEDIDTNLYRDYDFDVLKARQSRPSQKKENNSDIGVEEDESSSDFTCYATSSIMQLVHSVVDNLLLLRNQQSAGLGSVKRFDPMGAQHVLMALEQVIAGSRFKNKPQFQDAPNRLRKRLAQVNACKRKFIDEIGGLQALGGGQPVFIEGLQDNSTTSNSYTHVLNQWQAHVDRNGFDTLNPIGLPKNKRKRP